MSFPRLAVDNKNNPPEEKGISARDIGRTVAFHRRYEILPQSAAQIESAVLTTMDEVAWMTAPEAGVRS